MFYFFLPPPPPLVLTSSLCVVESASYLGTLIVSLGLCTCTCSKINVPKLLIDFYEKLFFLQYVLQDDSYGF